MNYEIEMYIPCDACGEEFPPHMLSNHFGRDLTCDECSDQISRDFECSHNFYNELEKG